MEPSNEIKNDTDGERSAVSKKLFANISYYPSGIIKPEVEEALKNGGAEEASYFSDFVTHLILGDEYAESDLTDARELYEVPAVVQDWVLKSVTCDKLLPTKAFQVADSRLFSGVCACLSRLSSADCRTLWALITFHGGHCDLALRKSTTHLVVSESVGAKYEYAEKSGAIKIVTPDWIERSIENNSLQNESNFHPRLINTASSNPAAEMSNTGDARSAEIENNTSGSSDSTNQNLPWYQPFMKDQAESAANSNKAEMETNSKDVPSNETKKMSSEASHSETSTAPTSVASDATPESCVTSSFGNATSSANDNLSSYSLDYDVTSDFLAAEASALSGDIVLSDEMIRETLDEISNDTTNSLQSLTSTSGVVMPTSAQGAQDPNSIGMSESLAKTGTLSANQPISTYIHEPLPQPMKLEPQTPTQQDIEQQVKLHQEQQSAYILQKKLMLQQQQQQLLQQHLFPNQHIMLQRKMQPGGHLVQQVQQQRIIMQRNYQVNVQTSQQWNVDSNSQQQNIMQQQQIQSSVQMVQQQTNIQMQQQQQPNIQLQQQSSIQMQQQNIQSQQQVPNIQLQQQLQPNIQLQQQQQQQQNIQLQQQTNNQLQQQPPNIQLQQQQQNIQLQQHQSNIQLQQQQPSIQLQQQQSNIQLQQQQQQQQQQSNIQLQQQQQQSNIQLQQQQQSNIQLQQQQQSNIQLQQQQPNIQSQQQSNLQLQQQQNIQLQQQQQQQPNMQLQQPQQLQQQQNLQQQGQQLPLLEKELTQQQQYLTQQHIISQQMPSQQHTIKMEPGTSIGQTNQQTWLQSTQSSHQLQTQFQTQQQQQMQMQQVQSQGQTIMHSTLQQNQAQIMQQAQRTGHAQQQSLQLGENERHGFVASYKTASGVEEYYQLDAKAHQQLMLMSNEERIAFIEKIKTQHRNNFNINAFRQRQQMVIASQGGGTSLLVRQPIGTLVGAPRRILRPVIQSAIARQAQWVHSNRPQQMVMQQQQTIQQPANQNQNLLNQQATAALLRAGSRNFQSPNALQQQQQQLNAILASSSASEAVTGVSAWQQQVEQGGATVNTTNQQQQLNAILASSNAGEAVTGVSAWQQQVEQGGATVNTTNQQQLALIAQQRLLKLQAYQQEVQKMHQQKQLQLQANLAGNASPIQNAQVINQQSPAQKINQNMSATVFQQPTTSMGPPPAQTMPLNSVDGARTSQELFMATPPNQMNRAQQQSTLIVNSKTKTALANMLSSRLQGNGSPQQHNDVGMNQLRLVQGQSQAIQQSLKQNPRAVLNNVTNAAVLSRGMRVLAAVSKSPPFTANMIKVFHSLAKCASGYGVNRQIQLPSAPVAQVAPKFYGHNTHVQVPPEKCLLGCVFLIVEYDKDPEFQSEVDKWEKVIEQNGGEVDHIYCNRLTHIICQTQKHPLVQQGLRDNVRCITADWLSDILVKQQLLPPYHALHFPVPYYNDERPCRHYIISLTGFSGEERQRVKYMIEQTGAKCTSYYSTDNNVLIARKLEGKKVKKAQQLGKPVVNVQWLNDIHTGHFAGLGQTDVFKYQQYNLANPFKVDYSQVMHLMLAWKNPVDVSPEIYDKILISAAAVGNKRKRPRMASPATIDPVRECAVKMALLKEITVTTNNPPLESKKPYVIFSGFANAFSEQKLVKQLGGELVINCKEATHLIMNKPQRTPKFLCCVSTCKYILTVDWLKESQTKNTFVDEEPFVVEKVEVSKSNVCDVKKILQNTDRGSLFKGKIFYITPSVIPSPSTLKDIIQCAGGVVEKQRRSLKTVLEMPLYSYLPIACNEDLHLVADLIQNDCGAYSVEFVLSAVMHQKLDYNIALRKPKLRLD